jgi:MFS family permease
MIGEPMRSGNKRREESFYALLMGICTARLFVSLALQNYAALIPVLQEEWQMSSAAAGSIISAYQVGFLISLVGLSSLTDWVSAKKVFLYSCIASAVTCLLFAFFARSYFSAFLLRGMMGLAVGGTYTPGLKLISEAFPSSQRGRAMGFFIGAGSVGLAGSLAATGWIAAHYGWQVSFLVTALGPVLGAVILWVILKGLKERKPEPEEKKFKKEIFANKPALLMIAGYSAHVWELEGMRAWTPAFLVACFLAAGLGRGNAVQTGASLSSVIFIMGVFSTGIAGFLSDRLGRTPVIIAMMCVSITCSFSFGWLIGGRMVWVIILGLAYGFSVIAESPVYSSGLSEVVSPNYLGTALGFRSLVGVGLGSLVPTIFGAILDLTNPAGVKASLAYLTTWGWAFSMLGVVALIGPWTMFKLRSLPESLKMAGGKK